MAKKPVHEVRLGRIKAAIWENETQNGPHNETERLHFRRGPKPGDCQQRGRPESHRVAIRDRQDTRHATDSSRQSSVCFRVGIRPFRSHVLPRRLRLAIGRAHPSLDRVVLSTKIIPKPRGESKVMRL